ncbi:MAG: hypothetical protein E4H21_06455 [Thermodesulfobacteriales bacterium]|nr:MAG: hypothetical protein E4H21_06455 [Thermodesulfobacteriales bacterium]
MDETEVTNAQFGEFVQQTNYITTAEKKVQRGGSFLCNESYCSGYRVAFRQMPTAGLLWI